MARNYVLSSGRGLDPAHWVTCYELRAFDAECRIFYLIAERISVPDIPASAAYLSVYEFLKKKFSGEGAQRTLSPGATLLAGGLAGIANWCGSLNFIVLHYFFPAFSIQILVFLPA